MHGRQNNPIVILIECTGAVSASVSCYLVQIVVLVLKLKTMPEPCRIGPRTTRYVIPRANTYCIKYNAPRVAIGMEACERDSENG